MAVGDHSSLIEDCMRLGDASRGGDPHLWSEVLEYFARQSEDCTEQVQPSLQPSVQPPCKPPSIPQQPPLQALPQLSLRLLLSAQDSGFSMRTSQPDSRGSLSSMVSVTMSSSSA